MRKLIKKAIIYFLKISLFLGITVVLLWVLGRMADDPETKPYLIFAIPMFIAMIFMSFLHIFFTRWIGEILRGERGDKL